MAKIKAIKERHLFSRAYSKGKSSSSGAFAVYALKNYADKETKLGITVGKKLGGAVRRNRVKRMVREAFYRISCEKRFARPYFFVVVAKKSAFDPKKKTQEVISELDRAFTALGVFAGEDEE